MVADTLYVIGGLYGNQQALGTILDLAASESGPVGLVFNGDFNWFNVDAEGFAAINGMVLGHLALRGNVETELAAEASDAGCGCAYPDSVSDEEVSRSNLILEQLRSVSRAYADLRRQLAALPMHAVARVGDLRIGVVHGDAESLAGWRFDVSALDAVDSEAHLRRVFAAAQVDAFASSHTCLPVAREFSWSDGKRWIFNNGAAGMPNFAGSRHGIVTRISVHPPKRGLSLYGIRGRGVFLDALPVWYDDARWRAEFLANWPAGSPAHASYYRRIVQGPAYSIDRAAPPGATP